MTRRRVASVRTAGEALGAGRGMGVGFRRRLLLVVVVARTILEAAVVLEGRLLRRRRRRGWVLVRIRAGGTRRPSVVVVLVVVIQVPGVGGRGRRRRRRRLVVVQGPGIGGGRRRGRVLRRVPVVRSVVSVRVRRRRIGVIRRRLRRRRICVGIVVRIMRRRAVILHSRTTTPTTPRLQKSGHRDQQDTPVPEAAPRSDKKSEPERRRNRARPATDQNPRGFLGPPTRGARRKDRLLSNGPPIETPPDGLRSRPLSRRRSRPARAETDAAGRRSAREREGATIGGAEGRGRSAAGAAETGGF